MAVAGWPAHRDHRDGQRHALGQRGRIRGSGPDLLAQPGPPARSRAAAREIAVALRRSTTPPRWPAWAMARRTGRCCAPSPAPTTRTFKWHRPTCATGRSRIRASCATWRRSSRACRLRAPRSARSMRSAGSTSRTRVVLRRAGAVVRRRDFRGRPARDRGDVHPFRHQGDRRTGCSGCPTETIALKSTSTRRRPHRQGDPPPADGSSASEPHRCKCRVRIAEAVTFSAILDGPRLRLARR